MSYRAAVSGEAARMLGIAAQDEPVLICNGCGVTRAVSRNGAPYKWFLNSKRAPTWSMAIVGDRVRLDWCASCSKCADIMAQNVTDTLRRLAGAS